MTTTVNPTAQPQEAHHVSQPQVRDIAPQVREAMLVPSTFNEADNTVEVIWTTGSRRRAYDWSSDTLYDEELAVAPESVDMTRFDAGVVQCLDGHRVYGGVAAILGVCVRGWITPQGEGRAVVRLSVNPDNAGIVADIKAGVIRSISFGYSVERYEITLAQARTDGGTVPLYRATRWTPQEVSFVTVPADPNAQTRAQQPATGAPSASAASESIPPEQRAAIGLPCEFVTRAAAHSTPGANTMPQQADTTQGGASATPDTQDQQQRAHGATPPATAAAPAVDLVKRHSDIISLCVREKCAERAADFIARGLTPEQVGLAILNERADADVASGGHQNARSVRTMRDEVQTRMDGMTEALMHRVDARAPLTDNGRQFRGMNLLEIGRDMLERAEPGSTRGLDRLTLATRMLHHRSGGMMSTSDFATVTANVANKRLRNSYSENEGTYTRWARRAPNAPDFKSISVTQLSAMPDLLKVNEHGEFTVGSLSDGGETYALLTYGRIVAMTRQAIINDDLRAFDRLVTGFGASSARLENRLVYAQLTANAAMADTVALFHATHANLGTGAGSALSTTSLTSGRTAMRLQKGLQGEELNLAPATLIVPAALEQTAYQLTSNGYVPAKPSDVNEFRTGGRTALDPVIEPILDANSSTAWYLAASNSAVDTVEFCWLDGAEGPVIESEMGFEVDGIQLKCREDFAAKAIDFRGLYKANGA